MGLKKVAKDSDLYKQALKLAQEKINRLGIAGTINENNFYCWKTFFQPPGSRAYPVILVNVGERTKDKFIPAIYFKIVKRGGKEFLNGDSWLIEIR